MSEYIDKFDALTADFRISVSLFESRRKTAEKAVQEYANYIRELPAEDVQPVVRCRDCVHWAESQTSKDYGSCDCDALLRWEDFYCAAGRRKEQT